jgi:hypothetical protein
MTIYVALQEEGVPCWRPVEAQELPDGSFLILDHRPEDERWEFDFGDIVQCKQRQFQTGSGLVAYQKAT